MDQEEKTEERRGTTDRKGETEDDQEEEKEENHDRGGRKETRLKCQNLYYPSSPSTPTTTTPTPTTTSMTSMTSTTPLTMTQNFMYSEVKQGIGFGYVCVCCVLCVDILLMFYGMFCTFGNQQRGFFNKICAADREET